MKGMRYKLRVNVGTNNYILLFLVACAYCTTQQPPSESSELLASPVPPLVSLVATGFSVVFDMLIPLCSLSIDAKYLHERSNKHADRRAELEDDYFLQQNAYLTIRGWVVAAARHSSRLTIPSSSVSAVLNSSWIIKFSWRSCTDQTWADSVIDHVSEDGNLLRVVQLTRAGINQVKRAE